MIYIPDDTPGTVWYCEVSDQFIIRYVLHWGEFACAIQKEFDPEFCPAMEYNFVYIGVL